MKKKLFVLFFFFFLKVTTHSSFSFSEHISSERTEVANDSLVSNTDTFKMYVFLDGIEIEMDTIIKRSEKGENFFGFGETEPRNANKKVWGKI